MVHKFIRNGVFRAPLDDSVKLSDVVNRACRINEPVCDFSRSLVKQSATALRAIFDIHLSPGGRLSAAHISGASSSVLRRRLQTRNTRSFPFVSAVPARKRVSASARKERVPLEMRTTRFLSYSERIVNQSLRRKNAASFYLTLDPGDLGNQWEWDSKASCVSRVPTPSVRF